MAAGHQVQRAMTIADSIAAVDRIAEEQRKRLAVQSERHDEEPLSEAEKRDDERSRL